MTGTGAKTPLLSKFGITMAELKCLLAILSLSEEEGRAATNQIARELQVKPPTVCRLLDHLLAAQLIRKEPYGKVELTLQGKRIAYRLRDRVSLTKTAIIRQLHLDHQAALQTALFIVSSLDEDSQKQMTGFGRTAPDGAGMQEVMI